MRPLKITAPIECLTEVHSEVVDIKYGVHEIGYSTWYSAIILYR